MSERVNLTAPQRHALQIAGGIIPYGANDNVRWATWEALKARALITYDTGWKNHFYPLNVRVTAEGSALLAAVSALPSEHVEHEGAA